MRLWAISIAPVLFLILSGCGDNQHVISTDDGASPTHSKRSSIEIDEDEYSAGGISFRHPTGVSVNDWGSIGGHTVDVKAPEHTNLLVSVMYFPRFPEAAQAHVQMLRFQMLAASSGKAAPSLVRPKKCQRSFLGGKRRGIRMTGKKSDSMVLELFHAPTGAGSVAVTIAYSKASMQPANEICNIVLPSLTLTPPQQTVSSDEHTIGNHEEKSRDPKQDALDSELWEATEAGDLQRVEAVLAEGANAVVKRSLRMTPLKRASSCGHLGIVNAMLDSEGSPERQKKWATSALGHAVLSGHIEVARSLIEHGADLSRKVGRVDVLYTSVKRRHGKMARFFLLEHPEVVTSDKNRLGQILFQAIDSGDKELVELLLERGFGGGKNIALSYAVSRNREGAVRELLELGADPNSRSQGLSMLRQAKARGVHAKGIYDLLLSHGAR